MPGQFFVLLVMSCDSVLRGALRGRCFRGARLPGKKRCQICAVFFRQTVRDHCGARVGWNPFFHNGYARPALQRGRV